MARKRTRAYDPAREHALSWGARMVAWVRKNVPPDKREGQTPLRAACWYAANHEAENVHDFSMRELAEFIQEGFPGYHKTSDLDDFVEHYGDEPGKASFGYLIEDMLDFWGIERQEENE